MAVGHRHSRAYKGFRCNEKARAGMEQVYRKTKDIDLAAKGMVNWFYSANPEYFLAPEIFEGAYRQMIRHIAEILKGNGQ